MTATQLLVVPRSIPITFAIVLRSLLIFQIIIILMFSTISLFSPPPPHLRRSFAAERSRRRRLGHRHSRRAQHALADLVTAMELADDRVGRMLAALDVVDSLVKLRDRTAGPPIPADSRRCCAGSRAASAAPSRPLRRSACRCRRRARPRPRVRGCRLSAADRAAGSRAGAVLLSSFCWRIRLRMLSVSASARRYLSLSSAISLSLLAICSRSAATSSDCAGAWSSGFSSIGCCGGSFGAGGADLGSSWPRLHSAPDCWWRCFSSLCLLI